MYDLSLSFDDFMQLPPDEQRRVFDAHKAEAQKKRKYGLYWDDTRHREGVVQRCETEMPVLEEVEDKRIHFAPPATDLFDTPDNPQPTHLLIEGDNYHALSVLNYTHRGKIDLIYIDPPYNTGNKDFRYNDSFVDKEDGDRHTKWLSFMHRRLELAKHLLKDTGVIFISIDENEVHNLRHLMDKAFGETNHVEQVVWNKRIPKNDKGIGNIHEYVLIYAKNLSKDLIFSMPKEGIDDVFTLLAQCKRKKLSIPDAEKEIRKLYKKNGYDRGITLYNNLSPDYRLFGKINVSWPNARTEGPRYDILHPKTGKPCNVPDRGWRFKPETFFGMIDYKGTLQLADGSYLSGGVWFAKDEKTQPSTINYLDEVDSLLLRSIISTKSDGGNELEDFVELGTFNYPKPTDLIQILFNSVCKSDSTILDFFAGSGTTGHAVLEMNKADGGRRQFIMVTNNEVTDRSRRQLENEGKTAEEIEELGICRAVTYPRVQKVIEGYTNAKGEKVAGTGGKLRYFRTDFVSAEGNNDQLYYNLRRRCTEMLCFRENVFHPIGTGEQWELFRDHDHVLAVLHDEYPTHKDELRQRLEAETGVSVCKMYVFSLDREVNVSDYADFSGVQLENVPAKIIDLYKREVQRLSAVQHEAE
jgi:adenine-specific DNA-methyltransferase